MGKKAFKKLGNLALAAVAPIAVVGTDTVTKAVGIKKTPISGASKVVTSTGEAAMANPVVGTAITAGLTAINPALGVVAAGAQTAATGRVAARAAGKQMAGLEKGLTGFFDQAGDGMGTAPATVDDEAKEFQRIMRRQSRNRDPGRTLISGLGGPQAKTASPTLLGQ